MSASAKLSISSADHELLDPDQSGQLELDGKVLGFIGKASKSAKKLFRLRSDATFAELDLGVLENAMVSIVRHANQSSFPPISRDFNFVLENEVKWDAVGNVPRRKERRQDEEALADDGNVAFGRFDANRRAS